MHSLVIIDMQTDYSAAYYSWIKPRILREINHSKKNGWPIIIIEYKGNGRTRPYIIKSVSGYDNLFRLKKNSYSGAKQIESLIKEKRLSSKIRVCGIYTDVCVFHTVYELCKSYKIEIVYDACGALSLESHDWAIKSLKNFNTIQVIREKKCSK